MIVPATLEVLAHAPDRTTLASFLVAASFATVDGETGDILENEGVQIHPFRSVEDLVVEHLEGETLVRVSGFHVNLRFYGALADTLSVGGLAGIATIIGQRIRGALSPTGPVGRIPAGFITASGVTIYEPEAVTLRRNVWT